MRRSCSLHPFDTYLLITPLLARAVAAPPRGNEDALQGTVPNRGESLGAAGLTPVEQDEDEDIKAG